MRRWLVVAANPTAHKTPRRAQMSAAQRWKLTFAHFIKIINRVRNCSRVYLHKPACEFISLFPTARFFPPLFLLSFFLLRFLLLPFLPIHLSPVCSPLGNLCYSGYINLLKPTGHVMHQQFNIQQLYALPTLYLCILYLSENKQRLVPLTA